MEVLKHKNKINMYNNIQNYLIAAFHYNTLSILKILLIFMEVLKHKNKINMYNNIQNCLIAAFHYSIKAIMLQLLLFG